MNKRQKKKFKKKLYHHTWDQANKALILMKAMQEMKKVMSFKRYYMKKEDDVKVYIANMNKYLENTPYMLVEDTVCVDEKGIIRCKMIRRPIHSIDIYVENSTLNIDEEGDHGEQSKTTTI